jgi:hypothetical protein
MGMTVRRRKTVMKWMKKILKILIWNTKRRKREKSENFRGLQLLVHKRSTIKGHVLG